MEGLLEHTVWEVREGCLDRWASSWSLVLLQGYGQVG